MWRIARTVGTAAAAGLAALIATGCAAPRGPILSSAIQKAYPGHVEVQPKLAVGEDASSFPYTPGTLILASSTGSEGELFTAETDFRCGHARPIGALRSVRLQPYAVSTGGAASISGRDRARDWIAGSTGISRASLSGVNSVGIVMRNVRRVAPGPKELARLTSLAAAGCPLPPGLPGIRPVKAVLIGDVRVEVRFERGFSLGARLALMKELELSFGVGYQRISDRAILGRQVAFAVAW